MKTFRIVAGILGVLVVAFFAAAFIFPEWLDPDLAELLYMLVAVPILIINMWAWYYPEFIEESFLGKEDEQEEVE